MSSPHPSGAPSLEPDRAQTSDFELSEATLVGLRGAPLLEGLGQHLPGSREHADASASYAFAGGVELGLDRAHAESVREAARLHDVGLVYVPTEVLARRREELAPADQAQLDSRFRAAESLASGAGMPERIGTWLSASGERFDGHGINGVAGSSIPVEAQIIRAACLCDTTLAAGDDGSGESARSRAITRLHAAAGAELDPRVAAAFVAILERAARP